MRYDAGMERCLATIATAALVTVFPLSALADLITGIPGPADQGGMIMPMISIQNADDPFNPSSGAIAIDFNPTEVATFRSLEEWSPGSWFAETAAWRPDLGSPEGVGGTPAANAGEGDLFNSQYGFMFMAMPMTGSAHIPEGKSLAIRMVEFSSDELRAFNYHNGQNLWDPIFDEATPHVLWNGAMWHNFFTLPAGAPGGVYTVTFEIYIVDQLFTAGTGPADYSQAARLAERDSAFLPALLEYTFRVSGPEGITFADWLAENLSEEELADEERTTPEGDPGGFGIPNLLRYAFALDARNPERAGLPRIGMETEEDGHFLTLEFNRPSNAIDLDYQIEASADLAEWEAAEGIWEEVAEENGTVEAAIFVDSEDVDDNGSGRRFLRVAVRMTETD